MQFSPRAITIAFLYNIALLVLDFVFALAFGLQDIVFEKPFPGFHIKIAFPSMPTMLSDIDIKVSAVTFNANPLLYGVIGGISVLINAFIQALFLSLLIRDLFEDVSLPGETSLEDAFKKFPVFLVYNLLLYLIVLLLLLVILIIPPIGLLLMLIMVFVLLTWVYAPIILLLKEKTVFEAISNSYNLVVSHFSDFLRILGISSVTITVFTTFISLVPMNAALLIGFLLWVPIGTAVIASIVETYLVLTRETPPEPGPLPELEPSSS